MFSSVRTISEVLTDAEHDLQRTHERITVSDILEIFHERGFGFVILLFALPAALPLPGLGINLVVAAPLMMLTLQQALGRRTVWLPERIRHRQIGRTRLIGFLRSAAPWMKRLEVVMRPRLGFVTQGAFSNLIGLCGFLMALSVLVPLPLTNTVPSMGVALMAIGVLMRDGLAVIAGMVVGLFWIALLATVLTVLGAEGVDIIKLHIRQFLPL